MSHKKNRTPNDQRSDVKNPNNAEFLAAAKNHERQINGKQEQVIISKAKEKSGN